MTTFDDIVKWVGDHEERLKSVEADAVMGVTKIGNAIDSLKQSHDELFTKLITTGTDVEQVINDVSHHDIVSSIADFGNLLQQLANDFADVKLRVLGR